jgi:Ni/Fe-hydrogenase 1 B-type cytochrome subunit
MKTKVYHWTVAARIEHWVRAISIFLLIFTGFYIHSPFIAGKEGFLMATMRLIHFICAYILVLGVFVRIYFSFRKDLIGDWKEFNPVKNFKNLPDILGYYLFLKKDHKEYERYNPLQSMVYYTLAILILLQGITGFAIYGGAPLLHRAFNWVNILLGGETYTRVVHYIITWVFVIFIPIHVYMGILQTIEKRDSTFFSIFTGYKSKEV